MSAPLKFVPGDLVFAKVKGHPPWPARVTSCDSNRYRVFFYGTFEVAKVKKEDVWAYNQENVGKITPKNLKRKGYSEGLIQIKTTPEIAPVEDDILDSNIPKGVLSSWVNTSESWVSDESVKHESTLSSAAVEAQATPEIPASPSSASSVAGKVKPNDTFTSDSPLKNPAMKISLEGCNSIEEPVNIFEFDDDDMEIDEMPSPGVGQVWKLPPQDNLPPSQLIKNVTAETCFTKVKSPKIAVITPRKLVKDKSEEEAKKVWVMVKSTSELIEINVEKEKPDSFDSKEAEIQWEMEIVGKIESGEFIPPEIRKRLEEKEPLSPEEQEMLMKIKMLDEDKEKLSWLKSEQKLVDLDILIKTSMCLSKPEPQTCINALEELDKMVIDPFMLKKQPEIVTTIRRLRKYVGPQGYLDWPDMVMRDQFIQHIKVINHKADQIYKMFMSIFKCQGKRNFWKEFDISVRQFKEKTDGMEENILLSMTKDPTAVPV